MPIQSCQLPGGGKGYRWGGSGKCYADRSEAVKQAEAAHANGYTGDAALNAGIILRAPNGRVLFLRRAQDAHDYPDMWCWPGGTGEAGETPEQTARRETEEETGYRVEGPLKLIDERDGFATFLADIDAEFEPALNDEHTDAHWTEPDNLRLIGRSGNRRIHPGTLATLRGCSLPERSEMVGDRALRTRDRLALDRASVRRFDEESGHLHVASTPISKATVNPYYGREIPNFKDLGIEADKIYQVLRPAEELEKAAETFAGKPLLIIHKAMSADDHDREVVVGAVGSNVTFEAPFLKADLSVWDGEAIAGIESDEQRELSCGYAYDPVVESGTFEGQPYDLRMTNIRGNHVALVEEGRAGPDVLVGDNKLKGKPMKLITKALPSRKATLLQGALSAALMPVLAADAKLDLGALLTGVNRSNYKSKAAGLKSGVEKALKGKLAQDEDLGEVVETVAELIDNLKDVQSGEADEDDLTGMDEEESKKDDDKPEEKKAEDEEASHEERLKKAGYSDEEVAKMCAALRGGDKAKDEEPKPEEKKGEDEEKVDKKAMDAAIRKARDEGSREAVRRVNAIAEAKRQVRPIVGDLDGDFDTAEAVQKFALDAAIERGVEIDLEDVHPSAYGALVKLAVGQLAANEQKKPASQAQDSKSVKDFAEMFPALAAIQHV